MELPWALVELRQDLVDVVRSAAALPCSCARDAACLACRAGEALTRIAASGIRLQRWRNTDGPVPRTVHVAGDVDESRDHTRHGYRTTGYVTDRWQACARCGAELVRGRWALFYAPGDRVAVLPGRNGRAHINYVAHGDRLEIPCEP